MSLQRKCDRCRDTSPAESMLNPLTGWSSVQIHGIAVIQISNEPSAPGPDLCRTCTTELRDWLTTPPPRKTDRAS